MELETWHAPTGDRIPNHPRFAVLIYHGVDAAADGADTGRSMFERHGWGGAWVDGIFDFHHFHSTSHEALDVSAGDVLVLPAGTGHCRASSSRNFTVVGAYPAGQEDYDLLREVDREDLEAARARIEALGAPPDDPVGGDGVAGWR
jgi:uncharacterized protein YjlB